MLAWGQGAEADATWCVDSHGCEFNCVNFQARLRDWARLGLLVAARGVGKDGQRVVSEAWIDEVTSWGPNDQQVRRCLLETLWPHGTDLTEVPRLSDSQAGASMILISAGKGLTW